MSFALNGRPGISDETRERILRTVEQMGWTPNYAARALSGAGSSTVGFVVARSPEDVGSEAFFLQLMSGMQTALSTEHYGLLFQVVADLTEEIAVYWRWKAENRVDGVVLVDLRRDDPRPAAIAELGLPAVLAGGPDPNGDLSSVSIDDTAAVRLVLDHLTGLGHERLGYITGEPSLDHVATRISVLSQEAARRDVEVRVEPTDFSTPAAVRAVGAMLDLPRRPSALIFDNEVLAAAGLGVLRAQRLRVPDDVAVVSLEDSLVCTAMTPQITALHRDTYEFGRVVAEQLLQEISGSESVSAQVHLPRLAVRGSTVASAPGDDTGTSPVL